MQTTIYLLIATILVVVFLLLLPLPSGAATIKCYSHGKMIYQGAGRNFQSFEGFIVFMDERTKKDIFAQADCIIRL